MRRVLVIALDLAGVGVESERRVRVEVGAGPVVSEGAFPYLLARRGVESYEGAIGRRHVDVVTIQSNPTVCWMELEQAVRVLPCVPPQLGAGLGVKSYDVILRRRYEHTPVIDDRRRFMSAK